MRNGSVMNAAKNMGVIASVINILRTHLVIRPIFSFMIPPLSELNDNLSNLSTDLYKFGQQVNIGAVTSYKATNNCLVYIQNTLKNNSFITFKVNDLTAFTAQNGATTENSALRMPATLYMSKGDILTIDIHGDASVDFVKIVKMN